MFRGETQDEADRALAGNPYKSFGEFMMAVKEAGLGNMNDKRLFPLRSDEAEHEGGYSVTKAMGDEFIGSLYRSSIKAPSGLGLAPNALGGFLVGSDRQGGLLARVYETGDLIQRVSMFRVSANSNSMTFNAEAETSRADGSRRGGILAYWAAEAGVKTASYPTFRQIELKLKKVIGLCYATDELLADASALESYLMRIFPEELRFVVEDSIINGTGAGMPQGILNAGCLVTAAAEVGQAATTLTANNLIQMWSQMWAPSRRNAVWLINQDVEPQLYNLSLPMGAGGQLVYMPPGGLSGTPYGTLFGRPVIPNEYVPTLGTLGDVILADLSQYYMIEKGGVETASSIHVKFVYDETCFRFVYRVDGTSSWNSALTPNNSALTQGPFVVLEAR